MQNNNSLNSLKETCHQIPDNRPAIEGWITALTGAEKLAPPKRLTFKERKERVKRRFTIKQLKNELKNAS